MGVGWRYRDHVEAQGRGMGAVVATRHQATGLEVTALHMT